MTARPENRGNEIRVKGKSMGRERSPFVGCESGEAHRYAFADSESETASGLASASASSGANCRVEAASDPASSGVNHCAEAAGCGTQSMLGRLAVLFEAPSLANLAARTLLMLAGIAVMALGIDMVVRAGLGNSPISACPNVLSLAFTQVSFGTFMLVWQCVLVAAQVAILRRDFRVVDLLQIPISVLFGLCIDLFVQLLGPLAPATYWQSCLWLVAGMAVLALGIVMTVLSRTVMNCGEAVVQAVSVKTGVRFGTVKVGFDLTCALLAIACAFAFTGHLAGVREGTIVCAVFTGIIVNVYMAAFQKAKSLFGGEHEGDPEAEPAEGNG